MRVITIMFLSMALASAPCSAQIEPQTIQPGEKMHTPGKNWFMAITDNAGYIYDATTGEMQGLISLSSQTPAVQPSMARHEFYAAASYYSRGSYGARTDILTIHDFDNLSPVAEVDIPDKITALGFRAYIGMMSGGRHVGVSNMTPAQSVSIVDIEKRNFVGEISTPGCSLIMPVDNNDFMTICGDGTLKLVGLGDDGRETNRSRSSPFFDVQEDAVYDWPEPTAGGWLLVSVAGKAFTAKADGSRINISKPWDMVASEDAADNWWPGGNQLIAVHKSLGLAYLIVHQGEQYSFREPGTEIWVFSLDAQRRIARMVFEKPVANVMVTQEDEPLLIVSGEEGGIEIYDALRFTHERTIEGPTGIYEDF